MTTTQAWKIRPAGAADASTLAALGADMFRLTYGHATPAEEIDAHIATHYGTAIQEREIRRPGTTVLIVEAEKPIGYAIVVSGTAPPNFAGPPGLEIARFYIDRPWQGTGVAKTLMEECLQLAAKRSHSIVWLLVWEHNPRALAFYEKFGFVVAGETPFPVGQEIQRDWIMIRRLDH